MDKSKLKKRIEKLKQEIEKYRHAYHVLDKSLISDAALDSLKNELEKLERENPEFITADSPTQRVAGKPLEQFGKVRHSSPMTSLYDAFSPADMTDWEKRLNKILPGQTFSYYAELKMDGLAVALTYDRGRFVLGATRGDGQSGEEVTQNLKTIEAIPLVLRRPERSELKRIGLSDASIIKLYQALENGRLEVRGEAIMTNKVFKELNQKNKKAGRPLLANPRNAAAGSIRQLDSRLTAERRLDCYIYSLVTDLSLQRHQAEHELARLLGFKVLKQNKYCRDLGEALKFHDYWESHRELMPFDCDGVVIVVDNLALWPKLGFVGKGPRFIMAYKFAAEEATTRVEDVVWQVGRTGVLTPTAVLTPVSIYGVTVSRATLHNLDEIKRLGLKIGDTVIIQRAGDVIPKVVKALVGLRTGEEKEITAPAACPMCGGGVEKVAGEVAYRCVNKDCYAVNLRRLGHWASKSAMDIEGLGPRIIEQLVKEGLVRDPSDLYKLTAGDLTPLERFAEKSAANLVAAIQAKKQVEPSRFIYALGIRHVGEETANLISQKLASQPAGKNSKLFNYLGGIMETTAEEWQALPDIGPVVGRSLYDWFHDKNNLRLLNRLDENGIILKSPAAVNQKLAGRTFVLTGSLNQLTRAEAKSKIRQLGGEVAASVSRKTDYLVAGKDPGSKLANAEKLGIKVIGEAELMELMGQADLS